MLGEMAGSVETFSPFPTFGIVRPAVPNTRVNCSPYGQSVFADAVDAVQSVDLAYDALINEVDVDYFDFDKVGYMRTASEVSSDNSALMRNVRKHENALRKPITDVSRALAVGLRPFFFSYKKVGRAPVGPALINPKVLRLSAV